MTSRNTSKKTSPEVIAAKEKAAVALALRKEGLSFSKIAEQAGYNCTQSAHDAVRRAIREILREPVNDLITLEIERLDELWQIQYLNAQSGDVQALSACMKIMERRAKYLGIDLVEGLQAEKLRRELDSGQNDPTKKVETITVINAEDAIKK